MPARRGGMLVRVAEGGQGEHITPDSQFKDLSYKIDTLILQNNALIRLQTDKVVWD